MSTLIDLSTDGLACSPPIRGRTPERAFGGAGSHGAFRPYHKPADAIQGRVLARAPYRNFGAEPFRAPAAASVEASSEEYARAVELNQIFTRPAVARLLWHSFLKHFDPGKYLMMEPSAGEGAFLALLPSGSVGIDLDPKREGVIEADFLRTMTWSAKPIAVIGNPPYGRVARTAIAFVNHAAKQAEVVAFILPRSFRKAAIVNRLHSHLHLLHEEDVPDNAFTFRLKSKHVPTVFQIWVRRPWPREPRFTGTRHPDFEFVKDSALADFAIQRIGAQAGTVHLDVTADTSWHYLVRGDVLDVMTRLPFKDRARDTAGTPSLAKCEIVELYAEYVSRNPSARRASPP